MVRWFLALLMLSFGVTPTTAKGWETPAAGESASGDIEVVFTFEGLPLLL